MWPSGSEPRAVNETARARPGTPAERERERVGPGARLAADESALLHSSWRKKCPPWIVSFQAVAPGALRLGPKLVRHRSPSSLPCASIQASPPGSVTISLCSWLIVEMVGSAVLEFGRGLFDWQCPGTALYGITA